MTLKQSLAGAVAFVALASAAGAADLQPVLKAPAAVEQQATGYVEIYMGGAGRANYWMTRDVSVQVDAQAEGSSYEFSGGGGHFSTHSYLVGGHWSWRSPQQHLFGVFAAAGDAGGAGVTDNSQRHGLIGAEAQWYWNQFTLYAQGGYDTTLGTIGSENVDSINAWFIRGTGRY